MSIIQGHAKSSGVTDFYPISIDQSLRFNDDDLTYLSRTPASAGNRKTMTFSFWFKIGNLNTNKVFYGYWASATNYNSFIYIDNVTSGGKIRIYDNTGSTVFDLITSQYFRDPSAWYHLVLAIDTTQATASNRIKLYINGEQVTAFDTASYPSINTDCTVFNNSVLQYIGYAPPFGGGSYMDGYLAEVHFCDGEAYTADDFGELKSGVWVAKAPSVDYGTNGFHLDFANSADIGNDVSGEGNDWTPNNFTASDVVLDSPTDNFATLNPLKSVDVVFSDGNLVCTHAPSSWRNARSSIGLPSTGKYYAEVEMVTTSIYWQVGVVTDAFSNTTFIGAANDGNSFGWQNGVKLPANTSYGSAGSAGDIFMIAVDRDAGELYLGKNGEWFNSSNPATNTSPMIDNLPSTGELFFAAGMYAGAKHIWNFGQQPFKYDPPA